MSRVYINLKNKPLLYEEKLEKIKGGICKEILPVSIVRSKKILKGVYHTDGYQKVSTLGILSARQALSIVEGVFAMCEKLKNNFFFIEEYVLSPDTVYTDEKLQKYKLAYIPYRQKCRAEKSINCFIGGLKKYTTPEGGMYLDSVMDLVDSGNLKYERIIGFIEKLKYEIRVCGIK